MNHALQSRLELAYPTSSDAALIRGFREGILLADQLIEAEPFLRNVVGRDYRGHLRRAGILFRLYEQCRVGDLPFEAIRGPMPRGNWHWVELISGQFKAHLARTDGPYLFPEDTLTRQDERFSNQRDLFEPNIVCLGDLADRSKGVVAWLLFGGGEAGQLQHLCWAVPGVSGKDWLAHINVLKRAAGVESTEGDVRASRPLTLRFKEQVEEALAAKPPNLKSNT